MFRKELEEKYNLYLKMVVSVGGFENYNRFFNIYSEYEEACRRILVITPYKQLEEVNEFDKNKEIKEPVEYEGNIWLNEYPLLMNPNKVDLDLIEIDEKVLKLLDKN